MTAACWKCGHVHEEAVGEGAEPIANYAPRPGEPAVCLSCCALTVFTGEGIETRKPTPAELEQLKQIPAVVNTVALVYRARAARRRAKARWN
ncbi:MAG TPA: hypothetical protein VGH54_21345 [Mycobacterium sp.]|jgi:hypothetical protein|uniref:hypothetical protein n=1 Tax=Mycobacterium sp. TaxID=1785 RepID=UPI002F414134